MKSRVIILLISLGIIVSINGCGFMGKRYTKTDSEVHQISTEGKNTLSLENISGDITISRSNDSGSVIVKAIKEIKVRKKYKDTPFDEIEVNIDSGSSTIKISTEYNRDHDNGFLKFGKIKKAKVNFEIIIPAGLTIEIDQVNGNVTTNDLSNDLEIELINGKVELENYTGQLKCEITNGSFTGEIDSTRGIDISTINGSVTLHLNNYMNANLKAETVNGRITEENLEFHLSDRGKRLLEGRLGNGDTDIDIMIETVNGKIKLIGRNEI